MESTKKPLKFLSKLSILCVLLPFVSRYPKWEKLLKTHSKKAAECWEKHKEALKEVHNRKPYDDSYTKLEQLAKRHNVVKSKVFDEKAYLRLFFDDLTPLFIDDVKNISFKEYNKLELKRLCLNNEKFKTMVKEFLTKVKHDKLNFFAIHGDGARIKHIMEGLKTIIP